MKQLTVDEALRKMAKIAGYKYDDCIDGNDWMFWKTWNQKQSDRFKKWFLSRQPKGFRDQYKLTQWGMFDLMYGFKIVESVEN